MSIAGKYLLYKVDIQIHRENKMNTGRYFEHLDEPQLAEAINQWKENTPGGACLALISEAEKEKIPALQAQFAELDYPLLGAMFPELIYDSNFKTTGVLLLPLKELPFYRLFESIPADESLLESLLSSFATDIADQFSDSSGDDLDNNSDEKALFLIFDGMLPNIATILERLYAHLSNRVHYFGVNAGSETFQPMPCLFDNEQIIGNGLLALLLPNHPGAILSHNYSEPEEQFTATSAEGNCINSINWQPAFDVYQELIKKHYDVAITKETFYQYGAHFPFGIIRMDGEPLVRIPVALNDDGSIFCVGEIPPNSMLTLLDAIQPDSLLTVDALAEKPQLNTSQQLLNFFCAGRRLHLGDDAKKELQALGTKLKPAIIMGAMSLGEIGSSTAGGYPLFHNATLVVAPWDNQ